MQQDLLERAQVGESEAFQKLFDQYRPVVLKLEQSYYLRDLDHEDWLQEGRIVFFQTILHFEADRGITLGKFFKTTMTNHILSLLRKQSAYKRKGFFESLPLDSLEVQEKLAGRHDASPSAENYLLVWEKLENYDGLWSELEEAVMIHFLQGKDLKELPELMQVSQNRIRGAFDRGKKKLYVHLLENSHKD